MLTVTMLRGLVFFALGMSAATAFLANGVYRITNDRWDTVLRSDVDDWDCYLANSTRSGTTDPHELWLVTTANSFDDSEGGKVYAFQNLAHQAHVSFREQYGLRLEYHPGDYFNISDLGDGSYSIRTEVGGGMGFKVWAAQSPPSRGSVKLVNYKEGQITQKWRFESMLRDTYTTGRLPHANFLVNY